MSKKAVVKITSDTKEAKSGLDAVSKQLDSFANKVKKSPVTSLATSFTHVGQAVKIATEAIKKVNAAIQETTQLYKAQATAEKQLEVAAKNNPYLDDASVMQLKDYASQLQSISTVGDETLLPMMAQLASAGRTQAEIQQIMSAALDVSASGMMSLDAAVLALNKTFSGNVGTLGRQISSLNALSKEELKAGKAVEIVSNQFKGMAEETALATGTSEQLKNAIGDYKELWGETFEKAMSPMRRYFTELISNITTARKKQREYNKAVKEVFDDDGNVNTDAKSDSMLIVLEERRTELSALRDSLLEVNQLMRADPEAWQYDIANQERRSALLDEISKKQYEANKIEHEILERRKADAKQQEEIAAEEAERAAQEEERKKKLSNLEQRDKLRADYEQTLENIKQQIKTRRELGEEISEEQENQQLLNAAMSAYIKMYSDPAFDRSQTKTGMWEGEQEQRDYIQTLAEKAKVAVDIEELKKQSDSILEDAQKFISKDSDTKLSDSIKAEIDSLQSYMSEQELTTEQYEALTQKKIELEKLLTDVLNKENEERTNKEREHIAQLMTDMSQYVDQFANISNGITALVRKNNEQENEEALTELSEQYTNGIISYEEYCEKKKALDKKAAQEEYKLKMWEWTASFLQATANIAQGVAKALAEGGPYAGPILAALIGASGAVQIATITANKPKPPSFATGGIVPGTSYSGDKVQANVNSGEMILNAQQQANLWKMANSSNAGGAVINMPVLIENHTDTSVKTAISADGLKVVITDIVNAQMAAGAFNQSMTIAQGKAQGVSYF